MTEYKYTLDNLYNDTLYIQLFKLNPLIKLSKPYKALHKTNSVFWYPHVYLQMYFIIVILLDPMPLQTLHQGHLIQPFQNPISQSQKPVIKQRI